MKLNTKNLIKQSLELSDAHFLGLVYFCPNVILKALILDARTLKRAKDLVGDNYTRLSKVFGKTLSQTQRLLEKQ